MNPDRVVVNASPLIVLFKSGLAHLLPQLFADMLVPAAVWEEVLAGGETDAAAVGLPAAGWAARVEVAAIAPNVAVWNLGQGESEVLTLALSLPNCRAMVDDRAARRCARTLGIPIMGTGAALVLAKRRGLIDAVAPALDLLRNAGLWVSEEVAALLRQQAGE